MNRLTLSMIGLVLGTFAAAGGEPTEVVGTIELRPRHYELRPGETIHYLPMERGAGGELQFLEDFGLATSNPRVLELRDPKGLVRAGAPGTADLIVSSARSRQRFTIQVAGPPQTELRTVPYRQVEKIVGREVLFVGHANLDGFDHTAVGKPGIDRWVRDFKSSGRPVVYWVSEEFPYWYTEDRQPDLAIISEGQEHDTLVDADRVVFTGGGLMFCTARNVQMTLHGMIRAGTRNRLHFIFPAEAIWVGVLDPYPAPMALLSSLLAENASDAETYEKVVVPFLDRVVNEYPVIGMPEDAPSPDLSVLVDGWNIEVVIGDAFRRNYRRAESSKTIVIEFPAS